MQDITFQEGSLINPEPVLCAITNTKNKVVFVFEPLHSVMKGKLVRE